MKKLNSLWWVVTFRTILLHNGFLDWIFTNIMLFMWIFIYKIGNAFTSPMIDPQMWSINCLNKHLRLFSVMYIENFAATLLYTNVPAFFACSNQQWHRRRKSATIDSVNSDTIFRNVFVWWLYNVHPKDQECFFVWMLLHHVAVLKSFVNLKFLEI